MQRNRWRQPDCGSPGGTFANPTVYFTTFTCTLSGETLITVHMGRHNTSCDVVLTFNFVCKVGGSPSVSAVRSVVGAGTALRDGSRRPSAIAMGAASSNGLTPPLVAFAGIPSCTEDPA